RRPSLWVLADPGAEALVRPTRELERAVLPRRSRGGALPAWPCSGWGLPSRTGRPVRWWSLTPPFHPYRSANRPAVCFLWHCPAGHPGWVLPTTLPYGARTFLGGPEGPTRPPD